MKIAVFFTCLFVVALLCPQISWANCEVTLKVSEKRADIVLGHGGSTPQTHTVILKPTGSVSGDTCSSYISMSEIHMNNVEQHDKAFQDLEVGDVVTGTLNYHRPSPYGKSLADNYHHGFRLLTTKNADYSQKYVYFRHIGLY